MKNAAFGKIIVKDTDLREFSICSADGAYTCDHSETKSMRYAKALSALMEEKLIGKALPVSEKTEEGHLIIISAHSTSVAPYSVRIEQGNIYIEGSYLSIDKAYEDFLGSFLGFSDDGEYREELILTEADNIFSALELRIPYGKAELLKLFAEISKDSEHVLSGTHCFRGSMGDSWISNVSNATFEKSGKRPAIIEVDLGRHSEFFNFHYQGHTVCDYDLSAFVSEAAEHASKGGIICVCIHMSNPLMNAVDNVWYRGHLGSDEVACEMLTEGTELNKGLRKTLESTFKLIKALEDNGVPFLFRPLHEMNGGWFWWCAKQGGDAMLSRETMSDFWKFFYRAVTEELKIKGAAFVYSPNYANPWCTDVLYAYPGDEYVDIVGCDWYTHGKYEIDEFESYTKIMSTGKPAALTEFGPADGDLFKVKDENGKAYYTWTGLDLLREIKRMISDGFEVGYFLTWTGIGSIPGLLECNALMNDPMVVDREGLKKYWQDKSI